MSKPELARAIKRSRRFWERAGYVKAAKELGYIKENN